MRLIPTVLAISVALFLAAPAYAAPGKHAAGKYAAGKKLARQCADCHAIGVKGRSPDRDAPAFRSLARKYPLDSLQEALAEGIIAGHTDEMPQFRMSPPEIEAFLGYLGSIQR